MEENNDEGALKYFKIVSRKGELTTQIPQAKAESK